MMNVLYNASRRHCWTHLLQHDATGPVSNDQIKSKFLVASGFCVEPPLEMATPTENFSLSSLLQINL